MAVDVSRYSNARMSKLGADVLQRLAIVERQACVCVPAVVQSSTTNLRSIAGLPIDAIAPAIHIENATLFTPDLLPFFPDDVPRREKDLLGHDCSPLEVFCLPSLLQRLKLVEQRQRDIN